jgi:hypothetical protein
MINLFAENFSDLTENLAAHSKDTKKSYVPDEREWKLSRDDKGDGQAIIRLLPDPAGKAYTKMYSHSFGIWSKARNKKLWYIEDSPATLGLSCPVTEHYLEMNAIGTDEAKEDARQFSRKINYITNVLVIKDPENPANEGKVFYWKFGTKLYDKLMSVTNPSEKDLSMGEKPIPMWHAFKGANIKLKIKNGAGGFPTYDDTVIMAPSEAFDSKDEAIDVITTRTTNLGEFEDAKHFKTYAELADKFAFVMGTKDAGKPAQASKQTPVIDTGLDDLDDIVEKATQKAVSEEPMKKEKPAKAEKVETPPTEDEDDLAFLSDL